ncbi:MAG: hypothetical protein V9E87_07665 [Gemmatimonadales bacterium]
MGAQRAPAIRDSAGIRIVTNGATTVPARRLDPRPILSIGDDESGTTFGTVAGAIRLSDGSVVVADGKAGELRLFSAAGQLVRGVARRGEGPGDVKNFAGLSRLPGDTVLLWDNRLSRLTRFTASGQLVRTAPVDRLPPVKLGGGATSTPWITLLGVLADGSLIGSYRLGLYNPPTGLYPDTAFVVRVVPPGGISTVARLLVGETYIFESVTTKFLTDGARPFTTAGLIATGPSSFWHSDGRRFELREYSSRGALKTMIRLARTPTPVTPKEISVFRANLIAAAKTEMASEPAMRDNFVKHAELTGAWLTFPATHPAFTGLVVASTGEVWAREYGDSTKAQRWHVFAPTGVRTATIEIPAGVEPLEIGRDYVLARVRNEDDVESVRVYRYQR